MLFISGCSFFIAAGRLDLPRGWLYYLLAAALSLGGNLLLVYRSPELLNERGRPGENTKSLDKVLLLLLFGTNLIALPLVAGLDSGRFHWSALPEFYSCAGALLQVSASLIVLWAALENPFFEGTVRLQKERRQYAVSGGPYAYIRHPGYLGMSLNTLPLPFIVGSQAALLPAILAIALIVIRTAFEDRLLLRHLPGYRDYARKVRYRLFPPIW
ncbi:MAG: isoprenylcysteine carboxylmethyltransferase family protein [Firmicutes bacterium]|nr:isoprenylcysteine carboxylmethyltransferase family protein [Bacillota bacterium]